MSDSEAPDRAREAYEAERAAMAVGEVDRAILHLEESIAEYPHFKALELLGEAWLKKGEARKAIVPLAAATTLNSQVRAPSMLAEALLTLGDMLEAHKVATLALDRDINDRKAQAVLEATTAAYEAWRKL